MDINSFIILCSTVLVQYFCNDVLKFVLYINCRDCAWVTLSYLLFSVFLLHSPRFLSLSPLCIAGPTTYQHCSYPTAAPPNSNGGYYPMYHVPPSVPPGGARSSDDSAKPLVTYSPFKQAGPQQGAPLCPQPPPSYHRSYTPTSSRSGRSHNSGESAVKYDITHKVALPVHL